MNETLNSTEKVTLRAFLTALLELNVPLPPELQQEINQVAEIFVKQPSTATNRLIQLAEYECIKPLYMQARMNIQTQYEIKERNKFDKPSKQNQPNAVPDERLENIALPILQAVDSSEEAKKYQSDIVLPPPPLS
ncbi:hypothetical protein [Calothrix sp. PCC 6303]|uniref:hypothetical protein n=1 Tax=Calothrix sp. PCC 6303 TaxID=1170562 RepID=UPI0002A05177|nr:hypothetical protein [Calothrix sp. PCC 6303]AFZ00347.1 hypothetical protein Cal6303_1287 [Calothrix sp. PCC 6303]